MIQDLRIKQIKKSGFTLVELLVVISIIAILVAVTSSSFINSQKRSRDTSRKTELKALSDALNMYYSDKGVFPSSDTINDLISTQGEFADTSNPTKKIIYMKKVPNGSAGNMKEILYQVSTTEKSFRIYTNLENDEDKDCIKDSEGLSLTTLNSVYTVNNGSCIYLLTSSNASVDSLP